MKTVQQEISDLQQRVDRALLAQLYVGREIMHIDHPYLLLKITTRNGSFSFSRWNSKEGCFDHYLWVNHPHSDVPLLCDLRGVTLVPTATH